MGMGSRMFKPPCPPPHRLVYSLTCLLIVNYMYRTSVLTRPRPWGIPTKKIYNGALKAK